MTAAGDVCGVLIFGSTTVAVIVRGGVTSEVSVAAIKIRNVMSYPVLKCFRKFIHDLTHSVPIN
jgi:hypothetical protein